MARARGDEDDDAADAHELQPLQAREDEHTAASHRRHKNNAPYSDKDKKGASDSDDYDEDFADETFRLRGPNGSSLELDRNKSDDDEEVLNARQIRLGGARQTLLSKEKEKPSVLSDDPADIVSRIVKETDDSTLPALTIRVVIIGTFFCILGAGISQVSLPYFMRNSRQDPDLKPRNIAILLQVQFGIILQLLCHSCIASHW